MKQILTSLCLTFAVLLFSAGVCSSDDLRATTEDGRNVILMGDGKWKFADDTTEDKTKCIEIEFENQVMDRVLGDDELENTIKHSDKFSEELAKRLKCLENLENADDIDNIKVPEIEFMDDL